MSDQKPIAVATEVAMPAVIEPTPSAGEIVPGVQAEPVTYVEADPQKRAAIDAVMKEIDLGDSRSIMFFGSKAQQQLTTVSESMLEGVKNKDIGGAAGGALNEMVATLRGFDVDEFDPNKKPGFFDRMFGKAKPLVKFIQQYETVRRQIDTITDKLETHKTKLLTDITALDKLYEANLDYFRMLEVYIAAGQEKLRELDEQTIPALAAQVAASDQVIEAQQLRDLRSARDDLERRVHDLMLTRQVTMQSLPSIRLVQENDKGLVNKISSTMVNTIPLWRQQLATAVTIFRSGEAAKTVRAATDLTNDLLEANAENLKMATSEARKQIERGVFDIESVKKANQTLIATIQESLQIADEGKRRRAEAVVQLEQCESELRQALASASAWTGV
ncbi:toxic anion resistance protein [Methylotetracoccus oryzae]|uniref:toxic anion resistance protein n=1 Tax=Methylotetracoccus oryzae TaxID=1919059 RepID=UPI00111BA456|nr:toxic anion resistance protein [Methylotetracoccus oryzae]